MEGDLDKKFTLNGGLIKTADGKYKVILSDDSIDREEEIVGKSFLESALDSKVVGLINHKNDVLGMLCEWTDKQIVKRKGHNTLIATPKWFDSNPNTTVIKGMLEEGANIGLSIGAIPKEHDTVKIEDKEYKRWTNGEILEASFVAIAANKHAQIQAVAKQLNLNQKKESGNMSDNEPLDKAKEIIEAMKGSKSGDIVKVLKAAEIPEEVTKDLIDELKKAEKAAEIVLDKAKEIIESHKESSGTELIKALEAAKIPKDVIETLTKPKQPKGKETEEEKKKREEEERKRNDKKSLTPEDVENIADKKVNAILDKTPMFKVQKDISEMTPEQQTDKAEEMQEKGMLPLVRY